MGSDLALYVESERAIHTLNPTARFIWESLRDPLTRDELLFVLMEVFDADRDTLETDLADTLEQFTRFGLIDTLPSDSADTLS